jgi:hypothetical protein
MIHEPARLAKECRAVAVIRERLRIQRLGVLERQPLVAAVLLFEPLVHRDDWVDRPSGLVPLAFARERHREPNRILSHCALVGSSVARADLGLLQRRALVLGRRREVSKSELGVPSSRSERRRTKSCLKGACAGNTAKIARATRRAVAKSPR